jgi:predicted neutral ceramidase superfamily lipid hydrolase
MNKFMQDSPSHESLDRQVVVRIGVANSDDDEDLHCGGLQSAVVDAGCTDDLVLVLDADQESEE